METSEFERLADETLARLQAAVEDVESSLDVELVGGILTIETESGGKYLLNRHAPNRQIWLSSPVSGAWHFAWNGDDQAWISTRGGERLEDLLARELSEATGEAIELG
jgi:frataxin